MTTLNLPLRSAASQALSVDLLPVAFAAPDLSAASPRPATNLAQVLAVGASLPWNTADHGRKVLLSPGTWREGPEQDQHGELSFWGLGGTVGDPSSR